MVTETILFILEIVGTVAFAVSGAFVAIKAKFDVFGVIVIGCVTAVGGGITRDILIGVTPSVFTKGYVAGIAALTSLTVFLVAYANRKKFNVLREKTEHINNIFDAIGLAAFTATGTELAFTGGFSDNLFLSVTLGVLTGVGGGVLRDILTETPPYIFRKHIYALASISGAALYYGLRLAFASSVAPSVAAIGFVIVIRLLATKYHWDLPKIDINEEKKLKISDQLQKENDYVDECDHKAC